MEEEKKTTEEFDVMDRFKEIHNHMVYLEANSTPDEYLARFEKIYKKADKGKDVWEKFLLVYSRFAFYAAECNHEQLNKTGKKVIKLLPLAIYNLVVERGYDFDNITMDEFVYKASQLYNDVMKPEVIDAMAKINIDAEPYLIDAYVNQIEMEYSLTTPRPNIHLIEKNYFITEQ